MTDLHPEHALRRTDGGALDLAPIKEFLGGAIYPQPYGVMAIAAELVAEVERLREERNDLVSHFADWHEDNPAVVAICEQAVDNHPNDTLLAVREWLDS